MGFAYDHAPGSHRNGVLILQRLVSGSNDLTDTLFLHSASGRLTVAPTVGFNHTRPTATTPVRWSVTDLDRDGFVEVIGVGNFIDSFLFELVR